MAAEIPRTDLVPVRRARNLAASSRALKPADGGDGRRRLSDAMNIERRGSGGAA